MTLLPIKQFFSLYRLLSISWFFIAFSVYFSNLFVTIVPDTMPTSIAVFNLYQFKSIYFEDLCGTANETLMTTFSAVKLSNGHLGTFYPVGMTILSFPLYMLFILSLVILKVPIDLVSASFEAHRIMAEKFSSCFLAALSVQLYLKAILNAAHRPSTSTSQYSSLWQACLAAFGAIDIILAKPVWWLPCAKRQIIYDYNF